jgi:predicted DNA-binding protein (MmcQ/YjbR family)
MKYEWLDEYCLSKEGVVKDFKVEWNATRYLLGDKMIGMVGGDKYGKPIVTLKCEPNFGNLLRQEYPHIVPGYYMNKEHWNSVYLEGDVPDDILKQMIDMSYGLILNSLPKNKQKQILDK